MVNHALNKRALVTGGAGLIGSHLVDLLRAEGWLVRILDNLEPQTHRDGRPAGYRTRSPTAPSSYRVISRIVQLWKLRSAY